MLIAQPLRIHIGQVQELLLFNNQPLGGITCFELDFKPGEVVRSKYECIGCFPILLTHAPEKSLSNTEFPLRIYVGPESDERVYDQKLNVWFHGRPLPVPQLYVRLHSQDKRIIRMHLTAELPEEILN